MTEAIAAAKADLRRAMRKVREAIPADARRANASRIAAHVAGMFSLKADGVTIASYRAMGPEVDPLPSEDALRALGFKIALPVAPPSGNPLIFRPWEPGDPLEPHRFGMLEPPARLGETVPAILLVPLLAFDREGYRLGYGGGYYDRTLAGLRRVGRCLAVGLAFCEQEVDAVPHDAYDERLDMVVTPAGVCRCAGSDEQKSSDV